MDKYNIISMTTDINELERDMFNWCMLPYDIRMQSIDDCRRLYNGMSVTDLYHSLKQKILKNEDLMNIDQNNIVKESVASDYDRYDDLLAQSKALQQSPYIVILDPDIEDVEELANKYYSYCCLNDNNQQLSDTYSWKIWGRDVYSMYFALMSELSAEESEDDIDQDSNIIPQLEYSIINNIEDAIEPLYNLFNEAVYDNDIITMFRLNNNLRSDKRDSHTVLENLIINRKGVCKELPFDKSILPSVTPWFTPAEQPRIKQFDTDKFYTLLKARLAEDDDKREEKCLDIGWNPAVDKYDPYARNRQASFLNNINIINLKSFDIGQKQVMPVVYRNLYPIFLIFGYDKPISLGELPTYNKIGISFPGTISKVYCFNGVDNTFSGIYKSSIYDFKYIDMIVSFIDKNTLDLLKDKLEDENTLRLIGKKDFNSVYSILVNTTNKQSPDNLRIIYSRYINLLCQVLNIENDKFRLNDKINLYKLYSGNPQNIKQSTVQQMMNNKLNCLLDNSHRKDSLTKLVGESCEELNRRMKPISCIVNK